MSLLELLPDEGVAPPLLPDYTLAEKVAAELASLGMALSAHPLTWRDHAYTAAVR